MFRFWGVGVQAFLGSAIGVKDMGLSDLPAGLRIEGLDFRAKSVGNRVQRLGSRVRHSGFSVQGFGFLAQVSESCVWELR